MSETSSTPDNAAANGMGKRRAPRWLWIGLIASVALNLIVLGLVGGAMWSFHKRSGGPSPEAALSRFADRIPGPRGEEIRAILRKNLGQDRGGRRGVRQARRDVFAAFLAEPVDRPKLEKALESLNTTHEASRSAWAPLILQLADKLTAQERRDLVAAMRRGDRHSRRRGRDRDGAGD